VGQAVRVPEATGDHCLCFCLLPIPTVLYRELLFFTVGLACWVKSIRRCWAALLLCFACYTYLYLYTHPLFRSCSVLHCVFLPVEVVVGVPGAAGAGRPRAPALVAAVPQILDGHYPLMTKLQCCIRLPGEHLFYNCMTFLIYRLYVYCSGGHSTTE
jgi:hypothetical protein